MKRILTIAVLLMAMPGCSLFSPAKNDTKKSSSKQVEGQSNIVSVKTLAELDALLAKHKNIVLDFWAAYCPPCRDMKEDNPGLAKMFPDVLFIEVDTQEAPAVARKYGVSGIPNIHHIKDGKRVYHKVGKRDAAERAAQIKKSFGL
jgi:thioredoxin 1